MRVTALRRAGDARSRWQEEAARPASGTNGLGHEATAARLLADAADERAGEAQALFDAGDFDPAAAAFEGAIDLRSSRERDTLARAREQAAESEAALRIALRDQPANAGGGVEGTLADADAAAADALADGGRVSAAVAIYDAFAAERLEAADSAPATAAETPAVAADEPEPANDDAMADAAQAAEDEAKRLAAEQEAKRLADAEAARRQAQAEADAKAAEQQRQREAQQAMEEQQAREAQLALNRAAADAYADLSKSTRAATADAGEVRQRAAQEASNLPDDSTGAAALIAIDAELGEGIDRLRELVAASEPEGDVDDDAAEALRDLANDVGDAGDALARYGIARQRLATVRGAAERSGVDPSDMPETPDFAAASTPADLAAAAGVGADEAEAATITVGNRVLREAAVALQDALDDWATAGGQLADDLPPPPTREAYETALADNAYELADGWREAAAVYRDATKTLSKLRETATDTDALGRTPLHRAALENDARTLEQLLSLGIEPRPLDDARRTPFGLAVERGHVGIAKRLSDAGGTPAGWVEAGKPIIFLAATNAEAVKLVAALGGPVRAQSNGETALHALAWRAGSANLTTRQQIAAAEALVAVGVDPGLRNQNRRTAADVADSVGLGDLARRLRELARGR